jgi:hypothetical protein
MDQAEKKLIGESHIQDYYINKYCWGGYINGKKIGVINHGYGHRIKFMTDNNIMSFNDEKCFVYEHIDEIEQELRKIAMDIDKDIDDLKKKVECEEKCERELAKKLGIRV